MGSAGSIVNCTVLHRLMRHTRLFTGPDNLSSLGMSQVLMLCCGAVQVPYVSAKVLHRLMPHAQLHIFEGGGHFAYYVCSKESQRSALKQLLDSGMSSKQHLRDTVTHSSAH